MRRWLRDWPSRWAILDWFPERLGVVDCVPDGELIIRGFFDSVKAVCLLYDMI